MVASTSRPNQPDFIGLLNVVQQVLQAHGRLFTFIRVTSFEEGPMRAMAEYCDSEAATAADQACRRGVVVDVSTHLMAHTL